MQALLTLKPLRWDSGQRRLPAQPTVSQRSLVRSFPISVPPKARPTLRGAEEEETTMQEKEQASRLRCHSRQLSTQFRRIFLYQKSGINNRFLLILFSEMFLLFHLKLSTHKSLSPHTSPSVEEVKAQHHHKQWDPGRTMGKVCT